jgi:hypothetical protein
MRIFTLVWLMGSILLVSTLVLPATFANYLLFAGILLMCVGIIGGGLGQWFLVTRLLFALSLGLFYLLFFVLGVNSIVGGGAYYIRLVMLVSLGLTVILGGVQSVRHLQQRKQRTHRVIQ